MSVDDDPSSEELARRRQRFDRRSERCESPDGKRSPCPCCGYLTLGERGGYDICPVCFWEDDGQDDNDADTVRGGPNGSLSLTQARKNFRDFGASDQTRLKNVRPPLEEEKPP